IAVQPERASLMPRLQASVGERRDLMAYLSRLNRVPAGPLKGEGESIPATALQRIAHPEYGDWISYNGTYSGNRHSTLEKINTQTVGKLQVRWTYSMPFAGLQTTPLVVDGVIYVSGPNHVCALDAAVGRQIWCYSYVGDASREPAGRGAAGGRGGGLL